MALRYILSASAPAFVPVPAETQTHFIGKFTPSKFVRLPALIQFQDTFRLVDINAHFVGKYRTDRFVYLSSLRQFQDLSVPTGVVGWSPGVPYSVATNLTATGNSQSTALPLTAQESEILSVTSTTLNDVVITRVTPGDPTIIHNYSGSDIQVWPPINAQIDKIGLNTAFTISDGSTMQFIPTSAIQFYSTST